MFVLTIDQQRSRSTADRVPELLDALTAAVPDDAVALAFERTVGDEVQGLCSTATGALAVVRAAARSGAWNIGVGIGPVQTPLPTSVRAATGPAFLRARAAVERAKSKATTVALAVEGPRSDDVEAVLQLVGALIARRSSAGWEVVDALVARPDVTQAEVARQLGISPQAVSQRLKAAMWSEETAILPVAEQLLAAADSDRRPT